MGKIFFDINELKKLEKNLIFKFILNTNDTHWKERVAYAEDRITKDYDYLASNKALHIHLTNLLVYFNVFVHHHRSSGFRKQADFGHNFKKLEYLNDFLSDHCAKRMDTNLQNVLFVKICQFYLQNRIILSFDPNSNYRNFNNDRSEQEVSHNYFTKTLLYSTISEDLNAWLYVFCKTTEIEVDASFLEEIIIKFDLFLNVSDKFFGEENVVLPSIHKQKLVTLVKTQISEEMLNYCFFLNKAYCEGYCRFPPLVLENKNFHGSRSWSKGAIVVSEDSPFRSTLLINKNSRYGFQKKSISGILSKGVLDPSLIHVNSLFYEIIVKDMQTPYVFDKDRFIEETSIFTKRILTGIEIDLQEITFDKIENLITTGFLKNDESRLLMNNLYMIHQMKSLLVYFNDTSIAYLTFFNDFRGRKYTRGLIGYTSLPIVRHCLYDGFYENKKLKAKTCDLDHKKLYDNVLEIEKASRATRSFTLLSLLIPSLESLILKTHSSLLSNFFVDPHHESRLGLDFRQTALINILISIGLVFKSELLKKPEFIDKPYQFSMEKCFELGVRHYLFFKTNGYWDTTDPDDLLLLKTLASIITPGSDWRKKISIPYDFSASGHQIRYTQMVFLENTSYDNINIGGETIGVDIYSLIIFLFKKEVISVKTNGKTANYMNEDLAEELLAFFKKETNNELVDEVLAVFNRKNLKRSLMTGEYNASLLTFVQYFKESLDKKDEWMNKEWKSVENLLKILYKFATSLENLPEFASEKKINFFYSLFKQNQSQKTSWDGFTLCIDVFEQATTDSRTYFSIDKNKLEELRDLAKKWGLTEIAGNRKDPITHSEKSRARSRHKMKIYQNCTNEKLTVRAFTPNFVHSIDASIVRLVVKFNHPVRGLKTVHDEYWVPYLEVMIFKDTINKAIKVNTYPTKRNLAPTRISDLELINDKIEHLYNFYVIM